VARLTGEAGYSFDGNLEGDCSGFGAFLGVDVPWRLAVSRQARSGPCRHHCLNDHA